MGRIDPAVGGERRLRAKRAMRLAEHSLYCYRLRYERPVRWSDIIEEAAPFVLLRLQSDTGAVGAAEITVKPTWCGVTARSLMAMIEEVFLPLIAAGGCHLTPSAYAKSALPRKRASRHAARSLSISPSSIEAARDVQED